MPKLPALACFVSAALICVFSADAAAGPRNVLIPGWYAGAARNQKSSPEQIRKFVGTITTNGQEFVLNEAATHKLYQLDDQKAAGRFANRNVTITGTLDVVKNIIRIQSIAEAVA